MRNKATRFASGLLCAVVILGLAAVVKADLNPTGTVIRQIFDGASGRFGRYRIIFDGTNNYAVFGSSQAPQGAALGATVLSSGTFVAQSTSSTNTHMFFRLLNQAGSLLMNVSQQGRVGIGVALPTTALDVSGTINATAFTGNGSSLSGLPGVNSTTTWTAPHFYSNSLNISSATSSLVVGSSATFQGRIVTSGQIHNSTFSYLTLSDSLTQTTFISCFKSTVTLIESGTVPIIVDIRVPLSGISTEVFGIVFLRDGAFVSPFSSTVGCAKSTTAGGTDADAFLSCKARVPATSAGPHTYCITGKSSINAMTTSDGAYGSIHVYEDK